MGMNTYEYGNWLFVIISIAGFIAFAFSFFQPKNSVDWGTFGGFSAFIIALFTEMYGIPLTLFFLAPWLEKTFPSINPFAHNTGMLWNIIFNINSKDPMLSWLHTVSMIVIAAGGILIYTAWGTLLAAHKKHTLATTGLYRYIRHPQYDGFLLVMIGYIIMWPTVLTLLMFPILVGMYIRLARKEEGLMEKEFGQEYKKYKAKTPAFIPTISLITARKNKFNKLNNT